MARKKIILTKEEEEIEALIASGKLQDIQTPESKREIMEAAARALARHGGKRPGSGRPSRTYVRANVLLTPLSKAKAERIAAKRGVSLSSVIEDAVVALRD